MEHTTASKNQIAVVFKLQRGDDITTRSLTFDNAVTDATTETLIENALAQLNFVFLSENTLAKTYTAGTGTAEGTWADLPVLTDVKSIMTVPWNQVIQDASFEDATGSDMAITNENPWTCIGVTIEHRVSTTHYYKPTEE